LHIEYYKKLDLIRTFVTFLSNLQISIQNTILQESMQTEQSNNF